MYYSAVVTHPCGQETRTTAATVRELLDEIPDGPDRERWVEWALGPEGYSDGKEFGTGRIEGEGCGFPLPNGRYLQVYVHTGDL